MQSCSGLCRHGVPATAMGRSSQSSPSPLSGPDGPLAGAHLTPRFLWLLRSSVGLGPAQSPTPAAHFLDSTGGGAAAPAPAPSPPAQAPPSVSRHQMQQVLGHPGLTVQQQTVPGLWVNRGAVEAPLLSLIPSTHSHFSKKSGKAGSPHPMVSGFTQRQTSWCQAPPQLLLT